MISRPLRCGQRPRLALGALLGVIAVALPARRAEAQVVAPASSAASPPETAALQNTLDEYARVDHGSRIALGWTGTLLGAGGVGAGLYLSNQSGSSPAATAWADDLGVVLFLIGISSLVSSSDLESLAEVAHQTSSPQAILQDWENSASQERSSRRGWGFAGLVIGVLGVGVATTLAVDPKLDPDLRQGAGPWYGASAVLLAWSAYHLATQGPVGTALHAYQLATGHAGATAAFDHLQLGIARGGGTAGFAMSF
jgi:hypothetical protein